MSTIIQQLFCKHQWHKENNVTLVCTKCGKVKQILCCHEWKIYDKMWNEVHGDLGNVERFRQDTLVCEKCGMIKQVKI